MPHSPQKRILVIDDEPAILELVRFYLEDEDYTLTFAPDAMEGLLQFQKHPFHIVISDRAMPEMTGDELVTAIKSRGDVPVILITSHGGTAVDITRYDAFLPKPFNKTQLLAAIDDVLPPPALSTPPR